MIYYTNWFYFTNQENKLGFNFNIKNKYKKNFKKNILNKL